MKFCLVTVILSENKTTHFGTGHVTPTGSYEIEDIERYCNHTLLAPTVGQPVLRGCIRVPASYTMYCVSSTTPTRESRKSGE